MLYGLGQISLYLVFIVTLLYAIFKAFTDKSHQTIFQKFKSVLIGLALIPIFILISYLAETDGGKRKLITSGYFTDLNFIQLDLFTDNTFKLHNSGPFGGTYYRGNYQLNNNVLKIDNDSLRYLFPSLTFTLKEREDKKKYFEPIDTNTFKMNLYIQEDHKTRR